MTPARRWLDRGCTHSSSTGEVVVSMRPPIVFANRPTSHVEQLRGDLRGRRRVAVRAVMVPLSCTG